MACKAVIFDLDGTLLDTLADLANASNRALERLGYPTHPVEAYRMFVGDGARKLCERMLPAQARTDGEIEQARRLFDLEYQGHLFDCTRPYPGIEELLDALQGQGILLGVVSNKPDAFVQAIVRRYFPNRFPAVAGQQGGRVKPDPSGVNEVLRRFSLSPEQTLYVGDSGVDMQTAKNARTHSCGVSWGFRGREELEQAGAEFVIDHPLELPAVLERLPLAGTSE